jgi:hypothetical protein
MIMKTLNYELIHSFEDFSVLLGTGIIPYNETLSVADWVAKYRNVIEKSEIIRLLCRDEFMSDKDLRLFAVWCAESTKQHPSYPKGVSTSLSAMVADRDAVWHSECATAWAEEGDAFSAAVASLMFAETVGCDTVSWADAQIEKLLTFFK